VGGEKPIPVNVRIITATHRDLSAEIKAGRFRLDLLYRLQVLSIEIPPLRERPGDVALLASHILERIAAERGRDTVRDRRRRDGPVRALRLAGKRARASEHAAASLAARGDRAISVALIESDPVLIRSLIPAREAGRVAYSLKSGEKDSSARPSPRRGEPSKSSGAPGRLAGDALPEARPARPVDLVLPRNLKS
jgi:hypothetical protein